MPPDLNRVSLNELTIKSTINLVSLGHLIYARQIMTSISHWIFIHTESSTLFFGAIHKVMINLVQITAEFYSRKKIILAIQPADPNYPLLN